MSRQAILSRDERFEAEMLPHLRSLYAAAYRMTQNAHDWEDLVQDQAALACHQTVFDYLEAAGYSHARLDILHMDRKLLISTLLNDKIKGALDPQGIIAPGRYFT